MGINYYYNHDCFQIMPNIGWRIGKLMMENHKFLYFQLAFLQTVTLPLSQARIQDNTTMEFQQNINFNSITDEIWEFLV